VSQKINPQKQHHLILTKVHKSTKEAHFFKQMALETQRHSMWKKMNIDLNLTSYSKFKAKWTMNLNLKHTSIKFLEENR
jgi:hypothetical protein